MLLLKLGKQQKQTSITKYLKSLRVRKLDPSETKLDVDFPLNDVREPQAPNYAGMWIDHFKNFGNIKEPLGNPMESSMSRSWGG